MYLGVDVGGTKTLVTVLNSDGIIRECAKFPTPKSYDHFLLELRHTLAHFKTQDFHAAGVGIPVTVFDRKHGRAINFGNLPWRNVPIQLDMEHICKCPVVIENDAKMAALSEAMLIKEAYQKVLYVTVSTGIGIGLVVDGKIDTSIGDSGGRAIVLEHKGKLTPWEDFASGHAIVETYNKRAMDIKDKATWQKICRDLAKGFVHLIALTQPEAIVVGGSVGTYFDRYGDVLKAEVKKYHLPLVPMPDIIAAQRPEEAVVYGCYDLAKQRFPHHAKTVA
jgi:predicted NBD/HSP70 family sugar kinase